MFSRFEENPFLLSDGAITLQMQWGIMTDKVWERVQKAPGITGNKQTYEFIPGQGQALFYDPYFLNHTPGMVYDTKNVIRDKVWECLNIPPRD